MEGAVCRRTTTRLEHSRKLEAGVVIKSIVSSSMQCACYSKFGGPEHGPLW